MDAPPEGMIRVPLSLLQGQMWGFEQASPAPGFYNDVIHHRFSSAVDLGLLSAALSSVVERHESLRTRFPVDAEGPYQSIAPSLDFELAVTDLRGCPEAEREAVLRRLSAAEASEPFELSTGPVFRARLFELTDEASELVITLDHMISDDTSLNLVLGDVLTIYRALSQSRPPELVALPIQYADYAMWQREWFTARRERAQREYWAAKLCGVPPTRSVPYGATAPAPAVDLTTEPKVRVVTFPAGLRASLARMARESRTGLSVVCLAALQALMASSTGDTDTLVLTTYSGRDRPELERVVGLFGGFGFLRTDLSGDPPFEVALRRARASLLGLLQNHHLPVVEVIETARAAGTDLQLPTVPVAFHFFHASHHAWTPGTSVLARPPERDGLVDAPDEAAKPLDLRFFDDGDRLWVRIGHHPDCFAPGAIETLVADLGRVLAAVADDPLRRLSALPVAVTAGRR